MVDAPEEKKIPEEKKVEPVPVALEPKKEEPKRMKRRLAILHVYSSKNDTIITATDMSGAETLAWASGGMMVKSHREEGRPYAAMQCALKVVGTAQGKGNNARPCAHPSSGRGRDEDSGLRCPGGRQDHSPYRCAHRAHRGCHSVTD